MTSATPDTVFKIGSVSKQFLATGIMLLVQDGKIALSDKISKYVEGTPQTWEGITVRHLVHKDVRDKRLTRLGVPVTSIWHYRLASSEGTAYYTFYTTSDQRVAFVEPTNY